MIMFWADTLFWTVGKVMLYIVLWVIIGFIAFFFIALVFGLIFTIFSAIFKAINMVIKVLFSNPIILIILVPIALSWIYYWYAY